MADRYITIAQAARLLERPESHVRRKVKDGTLREAPMKTWRILIERDDVELYARVNRLGHLGRELLTVHVVGELDEMNELALRSSGLEVAKHDRLLPVLHDHPMPAPVIVATAEAVVAAMPQLNDLGLLRELHIIARMAVVAESQTSVPWEVEQRAVVVHPTEPRRLVLWAWAMIEQQEHARAHAIRQI